MEINRKFSVYQVVQERADFIIDYLYRQPDMKLEDRSGLVTKKLYKLMPRHLTRARAGGAPMNPTTLNSTLHKMEEAGWIKTERAGKRTFSITLLNTPDGWAPHGVAVEESTPEPSRHAEAPQVFPEGRDGRVGAQVAKRVLEGLGELPAPTVDVDAMAEAVERGVTQAFVSLAERFLFQSVQADYSDANETLGDLQEEVAHLKMDLHAERQQNQILRENYNQAMQRPGKVERIWSPVQPKDVDPAVRDLVRKAVNAGLTVHRTAGNHLMFKSRDGKRYYTASTPGDTRGPLNAEKEMQRMGMLP